jgi:hypothetical protein
MKSKISVASATLLDISKTLLNDTRLDNKPPFHILRATEVASLVIPAIQDIKQHSHTKERFAKFQE